MLWYVILDTNGSVQNIRQALPHGNTRYFTVVEAERFVDAEAAAPAAASAYWALANPGAPAPRPRMTYQKRPGPKPKEPRCKCGMPRRADSDSCLICDEIGRNETPVLQEEVAREPQQEDRSLILLLEVQRQWQQSPNVGSFTKWLGGRIAQMRAVR